MTRPKAMILAAGFGTRLRPFTLTTPKPLVEIGGEPLLFRTLRMIKKAGVDDVVVNLHHLGHKIRDAVGTGEAFGLNVIYSEEPEIMGSGGGVKLAQKMLSDTTFFLVNGDALIDADLTDVLKFHRARQADATMVLRPDEDPEKWGAIEIDDEQRIRQFVGKLPPTEDRLRKLMFTGVHVLEPCIFDYLPNTFCSINDVFYPKAITEGKRIYGYVYEGYWNDVGTWESLEEARKAAAEGVLT